MYLSYVLLSVSASVVNNFIDENIKEVINDSESIYDGKSMKGKIEKVFLRGKLIAEKGKVLESKGSYVNRNEISLFDNNSRL